LGRRFEEIFGRIDIRAIAERAVVGAEARREIDGWWIGWSVCSIMDEHACITCGNAWNEQSNFKHKKFYSIKRTALINNDRGMLVIALVKLGGRLCRLFWTSNWWKT